MTLPQAFILGIVQGLTEFLPISSSGHLVLIPWLAGWTIDPQAAFVFDVLVQMGTLAAVIFYFRSDLWHLVRAALQAALAGRPFGTAGARLAWLLVAASAPASVVGLLFKGQVEAAFASPRAVGGFLILTALMLTISEWIGKRLRTLESLTLLDSIVIGFAQAISLFPGVSRSGATISGGLVRDLERPQAARFAFLMAVPIMLGAGLVAAIDLTEIPNLRANLAAILVGAASAALVGLLAIRWLLAYLAHNSLRVFIYYCTAVGLGAVLLGSIRG